jgi:hypothetical protein
MAKLVCTVELSKETGISIKVENADGKITQTITMDGTTLTMTVAGEEHTSTFTQKSDSIAIKCKDFSIDADNTITCTSKKATKHTSEDTLTLESTKDMTFTSSAKLVESATADLTLAGQNVKATAQSEASVAGLTVKVTGDQSLALKGAQLDVTGTQVAIKADAQLNAESSGMATLGGNMTTVKGTLINAG